MSLSKKKKTVIKFIYNVLAITFMLYLISASINSNIGRDFLTQVGKKIIFPSKKYEFGSTEIYIPRGTCCSDSIENDFYYEINGINVLSHPFLINYWKKDDPDLLQKTLALTLDKNVRGDLLGLPYLFKFNDDDLYVVTTMGWTIGSDGYFPVVTNIFIPAKNISFDYGPGFYSLDEALIELRKTVYKDQPGEFIIDKKGTDNLRPWEE